MIQINEWDAVRWDTPRPPTATTANPPPPAAAQTALVDEISGQLRSHKPHAPAAVHFYLGEGLRWIRVGFDGQEPLAPAAVASIGKRIASCAGKAEPLYFHSLRSHDMLFFFEGGKAGSMGMEARCFGLPLDEVLQAWTPKRAR